MVLCEVTSELSFWASWATVAGLSWILAISLSTLFFYLLYWKPTFELWQSKSNPNYPTAEKVREEIIQMSKGLLMASLIATLSLWLSGRGVLKGYCGRPSYSFGYELLSQVGYFLFLEFFEFFYHYNTHVRKFLWQFHKYHHTFPNPSPFAVIADEVVDQLVRAGPMLVYPFFFPLNLDGMFIQMAGIIYCYGTYLHCGHELDYPDAHHPFINTAFQHYCHHAVSIINKPYHCGFVLNIFDRIWGSMYDGNCFCCKCARKKGERSIERWKQITKPDYSIMLEWKFWKAGFLMELQKLKNGTLLRIL